MNYDVIWKASADSELAAAWLAAPDRKKVTEAANKAELAFGQDPYHESESRPLGQRVRFFLPLGFRCEIDEKRRQVHILSVWLIGKRPRRS